MSDVIHYRSFDNLDLVAYCYGPENPELNVLCLHGLTRNHKDFEPMIEALATDYGERFRFIAIDVRGRGESQRDPNPLNYIPTVYVRDVLTLIAHLKLQRVVLIGTSMGGIISMLLMRFIPHKIVGVVLNDIGPVVESAGLWRIGNYVGRILPMANWQAAAESIAEVNSAIFPGFKEGDWLAFARRTCKENDDGTVVPDYDPDLSVAFQKAPANSIARFYAWRLFSQMRRCPLLLVRGQTSDLLSERSATRMIRQHGNASLVTVKGVGHAPLLNELPVVEAIANFLSRLSVSENKNVPDRASA